MCYNIKPQCSKDTTHNLNNLLNGHLQNETVWQNINLTVVRLTSESLSSFTVSK